jgi:ADP-dependent NAD(P)H-hydrate dehydratase
MSRPVEVTPAVLAGLPLPGHDDGESKHDRGSVLVIGGSSETPGAVYLAGLAALRAGAGRLAMATAADVVAALGVAVPEAKVSPFDVDDDGWVESASKAAAVLYGSGVLDVASCDPVLDRLTSSMDEGILVLDAGALPAAGRHPDWVRRLEGRALLVPNPSELEVLGIDDPAEAAERFGAVIALRDADTTIVTPDGRCWVDRHGTAGLATSGSGDVAAGIAVGLAGRGAEPATAAVWTAAVHGRAGERLGGPGFLARELLAEIPKAIADLGG